MADCHPDRKHKALGLCSFCYQIKYVSENKEKVMESARNWQQKNKDKSLESTRRWRSKNRDTLLKTRREQRKAVEPRTRRGEIVKKYGITLVDYEEILAKQNGLCAICERVENNGKAFCVDHDHENGKIRGLLCYKCNTAIGLLGDNIDLAERAVSYLRK